MSIVADRAIQYIEGNNEWVSEWVFKLLSGSMGLGNSWWLSIIVNDWFCITSVNVIEEALECLKRTKTSSERKM